MNSRIDMVKKQISELGGVPGSTQKATQRNRKLTPMKYNQEPLKILLPTKQRFLKKGREEII